MDTWFSHNFLTLHLKKVQLVSRYQKYLLSLVPSQILVFLLEEYCKNRAALSLVHLSIVWKYRRNLEGEAMIQHILIITSCLVLSWLGVGLGCLGLGCLGLPLLVFCFVLRFLLVCEGVWRVTLDGKRGTSVA